MRHRTGALLALLLLVAPAAARAQSVGGRVVDARSGQPVAAATVLVPGTLAGAVSGADGAFALFGVAPGPAVVVVTADGYREWRREVVVPATEVLALDVRLRRAVDDVAPEPDVGVEPSALAVARGAASHVLAELPGVHVSRGPGLRAPVGYRTTAAPWLRLHLDGAALPSIANTLVARMLAPSLLAHAYVAAPTDALVEGAGRAGLMLEGPSPEHYAPRMAATLGTNGSGARVDGGAGWGDDVLALRADAFATRAGDARDGAGAPLAWSRRAAGLRLAARWSPAHGTRLDARGGLLVGDADRLGAYHLAHAHAHGSHGRTWGVLRRIEWAVGVAQAATAQWTVTDGVSETSMRGAASADLSVSRFSAVVGGDVERAVAGGGGLPDEAARWRGGGHLSLAAPVGGLRARGGVRIGVLPVGAAQEATWSATAALQRRAPTHDVTLSAATYPLEPRPLGALDGASLGGVSPSLPPYDGLSWAALPQRLARESEVALAVEARRGGLVFEGVMWARGAAEKAGVTALQDAALTLRYDEERALGGHAALQAGGSGARRLGVRLEAWRVWRDGGHPLVPTRPLGLRAFAEQRVLGGRLWARAEGEAARAVAAPAPAHAALGLLHLSFGAEAGRGALVVGMDDVLGSRHAARFSVVDEGRERRLALPGRQLFVRLQVGL